MTVSLCPSIMHISPCFLGNILHHFTFLPLEDFYMHSNSMEDPHGRSFRLVNRDSASGFAVTFALGTTRLSFKFGIRLTETMRILNGAMPFIGILLFRNPSECQGGEYGFIQGAESSPICPVLDPSLSQYLGC